MYHLTIQIKFMEFTTINTILNYLLCVCALLMCIANNPIESVLFLILIFCNSAILLFMYNSEFLALLFIIIYVGAIAILFLFVIMMLNIKNQNQNLNFDKFHTFLFGLILVIFTLDLIYYSIITSFDNVFFNTESLFFEVSNIEIYGMVDTLNNIDVMGQVLFNFFLLCFLLVGLVLLIALIGSIILTLNFNVDTSNEVQMLTKQLARSEYLFLRFINKNFSEISKKPVKDLAEFLLKGEQIPMEIKMKARSELLLAVKKSKPDDPRFVNLISDDPN